MLTIERKPMPAMLKKPLPPLEENFQSLLDPLKTEARERCRFDLFVVRKKNQPPFVNGKWEWCHRGDKYNPEDYKMIRYLVSIVKNWFQIHSLMILYDNSKPKETDGQIILKILNGELKINRLPDYATLFKDYRLPEYLSTEITGEEQMPWS